MADPVYTYYGAPLEGDDISYFHKVWIFNAADAIAVGGYIGEGTSVEIVSNWDAPFADTSLESRFRMLGGLYQVGTGGNTSLTQLNSRQVWVGNQPYTFNIVMKFRAFTDPDKEVELAIEELQKMMAPNIGGGTLASLADPFAAFNGRTPQPITINLGRRSILSDCCIRSMTIPQDKERDPNGKMIRADVSLHIETMQTLTKNDLTSMFTKT